MAKIIQKPRTEFTLGCMDLAKRIAKLSRCNRKDRDVCCAIISTFPMKVEAIATNSPSHNLLGHDHECPGDEDPCGCVHAEIRAVAYLAPRIPLNTMVAICTMAPCLKCAQALVATHQLCAVVCPYAGISDGTEHLRKNGIRVFSFLHRETEALDFEQYVYECEKVGALEAARIKKG